MSDHHFVPLAVPRYRSWEVWELRGCKLGLYHTGPWAQIAVWEEEECGRSLRGGGAYRYPPPQKLEPFPYLCDSRAEDVSDRVLKSQLAIPLHLHIRARLPIRRECAFCLDWAGNE